MPAPHHTPAMNENDREHDAAVGVIDTTAVDDSIVILPDRPTDIRRGKAKHFRESDVAAQIDATRSLRILIITLVLFGIAFRAILLNGQFGHLDERESIIGLMARAFSQGDVSAFTWGQNYGGTLEAMITSVFFVLFGTSALTLKLVPIGLYALSSLVVWRIGRRTVGASAAALGGALFWATPLSFVLLSTKARGYYEITLLTSLVTVLALLHLAKRPTMLAAVIAGASGGLAVWSSPHSLFVLIPAIIALAIHRPTTARYVLPAAAAFLGFAFPALAQNFRTDWASFNTLQTTSTSSFVDRLQSFFVDVLPLTLGLRVPFSMQWTVSIIGSVLCAVAVFAVGRGLLAIRQRATYPHISFLVLITLAFPVLFSLAPIAASAVDNHHGLLFWPCIALLIAWATYRVRFAVVAIALVLCAIGTFMLSHWNGRTRDANLVAKPVASLVQNLQSRNITAAYADDGLAYRVTFASDRTVNATPLRENRNNAIAALANDQSRTVYVTTKDSANDKTFSQRLLQERLSYQRDIVGTFVVFETPQVLSRDELRRLTS